MSILTRIRTSLVIATLLLVAAPSRGGDWPMWHYDAARTSAAPDGLPETLHRQWSRQLPPARPAWPASQTKLQFDVSYEPVVLGRRMFVGSSSNDSVTAYDTRSGEELWRFYTDGPVRFAPAAADGRVYATSDDGHLYCLDAGTGRPLWKFNGGPAVRPIIGNGRLVSSWPARGGVVLADGVAYFAASIWPSMGIFIHAVDAASGKPIWTNSETGAMFITHPHGADSFGSVAPQGPLAVSGDYLVVPGGRTLPAVFNRTTGKLVHFNFGAKGGVGYDVMAAPAAFVAGGSLINLESGADLASIDAQVLADGWLIGSAGHSKPIVAQTSAGDVSEVTSLDRKGKLVKKLQFVPRETSHFTPAGPARVFLKAGDRLYTAGDGRIAAYDYAAAIGTTENVAPAWSAEIDGEIWSMFAADERLFVVTRDGRIDCFGGERAEPRHFELQHAPLRGGADGSEIAESVLKLSDAREGYAIALGLESPAFIEELVARTDLHVIAVDNDPQRVEAFRRSMDDAGVYGTRVAAHAGDPATFLFPPYMANLIVGRQAPAGPAAVAALFNPLRPYGGTACLRMSDAAHEEFVKAVAAAGLQKAEVSRQGEWTVLKRVGALPDAGVWTHQYGDASNSVVSTDKRVKAPLGVLWFGGPSNDKVLPRHGHGPAPQVVGGRLFIEGPDMIRCVDVYTGRVWWERELPGVGKFYDNTSHQPGAGEIGSNYVSLEDHLYVVFGSDILKLDASTGETTQKLSLEAGPDGKPGHWGFIAVSGDLLIATSSPVVVGQAAAKDEKPPAEPEKPSLLESLLAPAQYSSASRRLSVFDRHTGKQLWSRDAEFNFRHNCICAAEGKLFCIDGMSPAKLDTLRRRGLAAEGTPTLYALDASSGKVLWSDTGDVFGTFLNYSVTHDVLVQAGSAYHDRAKDEVQAGIVAYRGSDGTVLWKDRDLKHGGPCLLWRDKIITNGGGGFQLELLTGKATGWKYSRMYGCNTAVGSEHLLTFRSGAAGFFDLAGDSGTGNVGGFKSSCTSNLIVADGVLNAPDYTRTCTCAYQNQTSLALIHMPEAELWTYGTVEFDEGRIDRIGVNLGAPGDRRDDNGTLWLDYPSVGGPSPKIDAQLEADRPHWFRQYSTFIQGDGPHWVAASGVAGIKSIKLGLGKAAKAERYTVRLHFSEPEGIEPGDRVFTVSLQGRPVLEEFDVVQAAGGRNRTVVREFANIEIADALEVTLQPVGGKPPLLCGIEIVRAPE